MKINEYLFKEKKNGRKIVLFIVLPRNFFDLKFNNCIGDCFTPAVCSVVLDFLKYEFFLFYNKYIFEFVSQYWVT